MGEMKTYPWENPEDLDIIAEAAINLGVSVSLSDVGSSSEITLARGIGVASLRMRKGARVLMGTKPQDGKFCVGFVKSAYLDDVSGFFAWPIPKKDPSKHEINIVFNAVEGESFTDLLKKSKDSIESVISESTGGNNNDDN